MERRDDDNYHGDGYYINVHVPIAPRLGRFISSSFPSFVLCWKWFIPGGVFFVSVGVLDFHSAIFFDAWGCRRKSAVRAWGMNHAAFGNKASWLVVAMPGPLDQEAVEVGRMFVFERWRILDVCWHRPIEPPLVVFGSDRGGTAWLLRWLVASRPAFLPPNYASPNSAKCQEVVVFSFSWERIILFGANEACNGVHCVWRGGAGGVICPLLGHRKERSALGRRWLDNIFFTIISLLYYCRGVFFFLPVRIETRQLPIRWLKVLGCSKARNRRGNRTTRWSPFSNFPEMARNGVQNSCWACEGFCLDWALFLSFFFSLFESRVLVPLGSMSGDENDRGVVCMHIDRERQPNRKIAMPRGSSGGADAQFAGGGKRGEEGEACIPYHICSFSFRYPRIASPRSPGHDFAWLEQEFFCVAS